jgi:hypothetical protein
MTRRRWIALLVPAVAALTWCTPLPAESDLDPATMKAALKTVTDKENAFVDRVLDMVKKKELPAAMVASTFDWARKKPKFKFQYFRKGLTVRAADIGVTL